MNVPRDLKIKSSAALAGGDAQSRAHRAPGEPGSGRRENSSLADLGASKSASFALVGLVLFSACSSDGAREDPIDPARTATAVEERKQEDAGLGSEAAWAKQLDPGPATKTSLREHETAEAWVIDPEQLDRARKLAIDQAEARGYTIIDLGDSWRPYIFSHKTPGVEDQSDNAYASHYLDLANDRNNHDGDPLGEHEHNYLELYGIPPTLSVVMREWEQIAEIEQCLEAADYQPAAFDPSIGNIAFQRGAGAKRLKSWRWAKSKLVKEMRKAGLGEAAAAADYAAAADNPDTRRAYAKFLDFDRKVQLVRNAQIRLRCETLFNEKGGLGKFEAGDYDRATQHALANFEKKHDVMGWGHFTEANISMLALSPREAVHQRLVRVLTERVVSSAGILEDGSARDWRPDFSYENEAGDALPLRDLAGEFTAASLKLLGLDDPDTALERLVELEALASKDGDHPEEFGSLLVALPLPELPDYYSEDMQFSTTIDRGDVWYDFPYDEEGNKSSQPRQRRPKLTLYVEYRDQKIPLVHWGTTIGSWRTELEDGKEYFKYKNSDVGDRVWQTIMAAPVWIPPGGTTPKSMTKLKRVGGKMRRVVNYDETGPGYMSAYGLVAGYHVKLNERRDGTVGVYDNQIRTHGSVDYMSILRRYSHGCHRLYNMNAVRMFSMILQHRSYLREGQTQIGAGRSFDYNGRSYVMRLPTRGYRYELTEPIPVTVTEGRIRGSRRSPYSGMMPKPGVDYSEEEESEEPPLTPVESEIQG